MIRKTYQKCEKSSKTFYGMCHAGLGEYVTPIVSKGNLLGTINIGFFSPGDNKTLFRINKTCSASQSLDYLTAVDLYKNNISKANITSNEIITIMEMLAEYLSFSYESYLNIHCEKNSGRHYNSSENTIITQATSFIRQNFIYKITINELADFCHCSISYLSHIFKRHTGININTYINKIRVEESKEFLISNDLSISQIAINVGFNDPNYYSRVFTQLTDISPKEFRRRFQYPD